MAITTIYAKYDAGERTHLWNDIYILSHDMTLPWMMDDRGDFNVILHEEEKIDGLLVYLQEYEDFAFSINSCELFDIRYKGSPFTWWNARAIADCIIKRLDRVLLNQTFLGLFLTAEVEHLVRIGSHHASLLFTCGAPMSLVAGPFTFLKFWTEVADFKEVV